MNARLPDLTRVDLATIAAATGVHPDNVWRWTKRDGWPKGQEVGKGGRLTWAVDELPDELPRKRGAPVRVRQAVVMYLARQMARAVASPSDTLTPSPSPASGRWEVLAAPGGQSIPAGLPSPVDSSPAATVAGGLTGGGGATSATYIASTEVWRADDARLIEAARRKMIIAPILRGEIKGRGAIEQHARAHGETASTLYRWVQRFRHGGDPALADKPRADRGQARVIISEDWQRFMNGALVPKDKMLSIAGEMAMIVRGLWAQQGKKGWRQVALLAMPELVRRTVEATGCAEHVAKAVCNLPRRFVEGERRFTVIALKDRDAKGFYDRTVAVRRDRSALKPGDCVFGDVSPADIPVLRPDGEIAYARLIAWMDAATNMLHITGHLPGKGAAVRREHVALAFTAMCQSAPWGMPKRLYLDNGSEYSWTQMLDAWAQLTRLTGGVFAGTWDGFMAGEHYGIVTRSIPFRPRAKLIEGVFGNFLHFMGWHPAFIGSDRMRKKVASLGKGVKPIPVEELQDFLAKAVAAYHATPQAGHLDGKSPAEKMAEFLAEGFRPYQADADTLAFAFGETMEARCRMGQVRAGGWTYYHQELVGYDGEKIEVRWARHAPDAAYCFYKGRFICAALPLPVFAWGDPEGAKLAAKLAGEARRVVEVMRGQVAWLDPRDLMGEFARLSEVERVIDAAGKRALKIVLTPEAQAIADARRAQLEALTNALPRNPDLVANRHGVVDEEAEAFRQWLEA